MTTSTNLKDQVKKSGILYGSDLNAELYLVIGKWNPVAKKPNHHWYMISPNTGIHSITTQSNRPDERVLAHWEGFKKIN